MGKNYILFKHLSLLTLLVVNGESNGQGHKIHAHNDTLRD